MVCTVGAETTPINSSIVVVALFKSYSLLFGSTDILTCYECQYHGDGSLTRATDFIRLAYLIKYDSRV